jgi:hypothetical protein
VPETEFIEAALFDVTCPRCGVQNQSQRFYGPCEACRDELRATVTGAAREVEVAAFEPATHVTPNAVALKE